MAKKKKEKTAPATEHQPLITQKPPKTGKRIWIFISIVLFLLLTLSISFTGQLLFLPQMVENKVNQILADVSQNGNVALQVRNIGLFQTNIGCQIFADNNENKTDSRVAAINSLTVEYSPFELLRGKIKNINIENADLLTEYQNGVFSMPALDVIMKTFIQQKSSTEKSDTTVPEDLNRLIPIRTEQINISGNLVLNVENDIVFIHYQAMLKPDSESQNWNHITYQLNIVNQSNRIQFAGDYIHAERKILLNAQAALFSKTIPAAFRQKLVKGLHVDSNIDFKGAYFWDKKELQDAELNGDFSLFYMPDKKIKIHCKPIIKQTYQQNKFQGTLSGLSGDIDGIPLDIKNLTVNRNSKQDDKLTGSVAIQAGQGKKLDMAWDYIWSVNDLKNWQLILNPTEDSLKKSQQFTRDQFAVSSHTAAIQSIIRCDNGEISLDGKAALSQVSSTVPGNTRITVPDLMLTAKGKLNQKINFNLQQKSPSADIQQKFQTYQQKQMNIRAEYSFKDAGTNAVLTVKNGNLLIPKQEIEIKNMQQNLPLIWPSPAANAPVGTVELGHAVFRKIPLASATADVKFEKQKILLKSRGSVLNQTFEFTSETAPFEPGGLISENQFKIPKQSIAGLEPLYPLFPDIEPWKCEGDLELSAAYHIYPQKSGGSAEIYWTDGKVKNQDLQLNVEGINFNFALPNLPVMESQANQNLSFRKASFQQIHTENGDIQFRMESPKVWYIENLNLKWCDGKIRLASTKIAPEEQKLAAVLHCDRIQLTRFLSQVGLGDLKGNGSISGMLPIRLEQNKIMFQDGFLYSTPGEQGRILGNISDELWHNVNQATGGTVNAELDLAKDALKDFTYSWAKIYLESEENRDALHLKLQFDGKPEQLLYYEFNEQKQGFQKAKVPYRFQGIQLDVNITLPINNTLKVLNSLSSAFNRQ